MSVLGTVGNVAGDLGKGIAGTLEAFSKDAIQLRDDAFQRKREQQQMEFESALKGMQDDAIALQQAREAGDVGKVNDISRRMGIRKEAIDKLTSGNKDVQGAWQQTLQQLGKHLRKPVPPPQPQGQPGMMAQQALPLPQFGASQYADVLSGGLTENQQTDLKQALAFKRIDDLVAQGLKTPEEAKELKERIAVEKSLGLSAGKGGPKTFGAIYQAEGPDGKLHRWQRYVDNEGKIIQQDLGVSEADAKPTGELRNRLEAQKIIDKANDPNVKDKPSAGQVEQAKAFIATEDARFASIKMGPGVLGQMRRAQADLLDPAASPANKAAAREFFAERKAALDAKIQSTQGMLDPETIEFAARMYLLTDQMPNLGLGGTRLKAQIIKRAAELAMLGNQNPEDIAANQAFFRAERGAAGRLEGQRALTESFAKTADSNLDLAQDLGRQVARSGSPKLNSVWLHFKGQYVGDDDTLAFESAVAVAANEYAKVITGQTSGAAVSDAARRETQKLLNATYSQSSFDAVVKVMKQEMENRRKGFSEGAADVRGRLAKPEAATKPSGTGGTGNPPSNPDKKTYDALPDGAPYLWNGVLHYKGKK